MSEDLGPGDSMSYSRIVERTRAATDAVVPPGETVAVVSKGDPEILRLGSREGWHFPQTDLGTYQGFHPANSRAAIRHLEALRADGATYLLFPETSFWWLESYPQLRRHLDRRYARVWEDEACIIFRLSRWAKWFGWLGGRGGGTPEQSVGTASALDAAAVAPPEVRVDVQANLLSPDWLLAVGSVSVDPNVGVHLVLDGNSISSEVHRFSYEVGRDPDAGPWTVFLIRRPPPEADSASIGTLVVDGPGGARPLGSFDLADDVVELPELLSSSGLSDCERDVRRELVDFLASVPNATADPGLCAILATLSDVQLHASLLSPEWLLVVASTSVDATVALRLVRDGETIPADMRRFSYEVGDDPDTDSRTVLLIRRPRPEADGESIGTLVMDSPEGLRPIGPFDLGDVVDDLPALLASGVLATPGPEVRRSLLDFFVSTLAELADRRLSATLVTVRDALRVRLPECKIASDSQQGLALEAVLSVDDTTFYVKGWARDAESRITRLTAVSPEGVRQELIDRAFWYRRPDVEQLYAASLRDPDTRKTGLVCYFELPVPSVGTEGWMLEMENDKGDCVECRGPHPVRDSKAVRDTVLRDLALERPPSEKLRAHHVLPAVSKLQERHSEGVSVDEVMEFGQAPANPDVTIVVPLYRRIDFLEHQLAQFAHDADVGHADLIYVLDSPELADGLATSAAQLFELYQVPFRVAFLRHSSGYSAANNAGASLARGRLLVLLNSDVLPERPGWLGEMVRCYDATPEIGALGPKLVYEDESLQHAGMYFARVPLSGLWGNEHYFKGLHRDFPPANIASATEQAR